MKGVAERGGCGGGIGGPRLITRRDTLLHLLIACPPLGTGTSIARLVGERQKPDLRSEPPVAAFMTTLSFGSIVYETRAFRNVCPTRAFVDMPQLQNRETVEHLSYAQHTRWYWSYSRAVKYGASAPTQTVIPLKLYAFKKEHRPDRAKRQLAP